MFKHFEQAGETEEIEPLESDVVEKFGDVGS